jgi:hypothetical protein
MSSQRNRKDAALSVSKALPAAAANNDSDSIDLEQVYGGRIENVELEISVPALPALVEAKTVTITIQDSADDSSFAAVTGLATFVITGAVGNGAAAVSRRIKLPPITRRYVRWNQAVLTGGGDNTGVSVTGALVF